jgi:hypothetical protein
MEISGFVPLSVNANQVLAVTATTGNVQLTNVGEHVTANVILWNSGPNSSHELGCKCWYFMFIDWWVYSSC